MQYVIQARRVTVGGNVLLIKRLSRRAANEFAERMKQSGDNVAEQERIGLELVAKNVTLEDGTSIDCDDVPADDLVQLLRLVVQGETRSIADFTGTP